jgi:cytoskeleton bundling-enhancing protein CbeA-like protein
MGTAPRHHPCFGARRSGGNRLHYLGDRPGSTVTFSALQLRALDRSFRHLSDRWNRARSGELDPHKAHTLRREKEGLICEADTRGSCGYVYVSVYPAPQPA